MVKVTLDVTGMYFSKEVEVEPNSSVKQVMDTVQTSTTGASQQFSFKAKINPRNGREFVGKITVFHTGPAVSRQYQPGGDPPNRYKSGEYEWDDEINPKLPEEVPQLIWQYYVTDKDGKSKSGKFGGTRVIVPFSESDVGALGYEAPVVFEDGDVITWRMVGIFVRREGGSRSERTIKFV
jgi:hypothetical protein